MRSQSSASKAPARVFGPARTSSPRRHGIHPAIFYGSFAFLCCTNVATAVGFLMAPDIAQLIDGQSEQVYSAYEDRIAQLRVEVDRLHSRQYAQAGDLNLQLQELTQQQEVLLEQHQYVKQLADKAAELGIRTADLAPAAEDDDAPPAALVTSALSYAPETASDPAGQIEAAAARVNAMMEDSRLALAAISKEADKATHEIVAALDGIGIEPDLPEADAMGGPLLPATDGPDAGSIVDDANGVMESLLRFKAARSAIDGAPIHKPIAGAVRISSTFGNRRDPFTRHKAFHAGLDFPAAQGTTVLAAGAGKVVFVGQRSGYGNVVEIEHADGLITRYGHLSAFIAKEGQMVETGTPIARVGSTGRSTGPHLHFEVRRKDVAVDPSGYLAVGKRLIRFLGA